MSNPPDIWTDEEKTFLLTEIIKKARVPPVYLYNMIQEHRISPAFMEIPLPPGRSLIACQNAYYNMAQEYGAISQHRQSLSSPNAPLQISPGDRKRPLHPLPPDKPPASHRAIQPKPTPPVRYPSTDSRTSQQLSASIDSSLFNEPPRKRGRPSKEELRRRSQVALARGETYPPIRHDLQRPGMPFAPSIPVGTNPEAPPFSPARPQVMGSHAYGAQTQPAEYLGSQTQDIRVHRAPRPQPSPSTGAPVGPTPLPGPGESTPRTTIEDQTPLPSTSLTPSLKGTNQPSSAPVSPRSEAPLVSSTATVDNGKDTNPTFSRARSGSGSAS
ncbi:hypothetical protein AJ78_07072 [Emergomyces pasteurianus Ep9510]|uniref:Uncharacterized protein n=1 Tax=Emergomyces pasteurianus Ep9510 TaxID=1447872 RepID=A0A1J9P8R1_9EURO|nr:hypothetical protein AJ78_07072 [Emergomyces pasteurianus Ep9510]